MSQADDLQRELMTIFQAELEEHLGTLNKGLLTLEQDPSAETRVRILTDLFRAAHSLKGAARAVGLKDIEAIAHRLEDALSSLRQEQRVLTSAYFDQLLAAADAIRDAMAAHLRGEQLPRERLTALYDRLEAVIQDKAAPAAQPSGSSPLAQPAASQPSIKPTRPPASLSSSPAGQPAPSPARPMAADDTIRVATTKLDALMDSLGELLVARMRAEQLLEQARGVQQRLTRWQKHWRKTRPLYHRFQRQARPPAASEVSPLLDFLAQNEAQLKTFGVELNTLVRRLASDRNHLQLVTDDLQNGIRNARMLPIATLFDFFPRMVRDLAHERGKDIVLQVEGTETEVDRQALELMKDPLTHLLRNAVDHGIEPPDQRLAAGKSPHGTIRLHAEQRGNNLRLEVSDDGQGIDPEAVRRAALESGLISAPEAASLTEQETLALIFRPGLSTAKQVTAISGRGVGMDVVRDNLEQLRGLIQIATRVGLGTTFTLTLPLTLATSHVLLVRAAQETLALPMINVERILRVGLERVGSVEGRPAIYAEGRPLPLINLAQVLKLPEAEQPLPPNAKIPVVVLGAVEKRVALRVDSFLSTQEVVVKPLGQQLQRVRNVAGATILGDGQLVIVLNVSDLMKSIQGLPTASAALPIAAQAARPRRVLVADDSITTRTLEKHILENAGYQVVAVADGQAAWESIRRHENELPDLVVSDINMPNMDGFALTEAIKGENRYALVPVVLITSMESPQDKIRGLEAGADAYIVKSSFDQRELLETIERLIG